MKKKLLGQVEAIFLTGEPQWDLKSDQGWSCPECFSDATRWYGKNSLDGEGHVVLTLNDDNNSHRAVGINKIAASKY